MFSYFQPSHIPALIAVSTMALGRLWPTFNARAAMLKFGLSSRIGNTSAAATVMIIGNVRTTIISFSILLIYSRRQIDVVVYLYGSKLVTGTYAGLMDGCIF